MPLPPLGHTLLTQPLLVDGEVFIPDLARRMHELPPPSVLLYVAGEGAQDVADQLRRRGRLAEVKDNDPETREDLASRPRWRLWKPDPWVEHIIGVGSALDVGCGSGRDAVALASSGWQVVAADPLPDAIERGRDLEARYGDGPSVDWRNALPDQVFDLVLLIRCGRPELLEPARERVAPGGRLLLVGRTSVFPNLESLDPLTLEIGPDWTRAEFRVDGPNDQPDLLEKPV